VIKTAILEHCKPVSF